MKRVILILLSFVFVSGVCYSQQVPIKRKNKKTTGQTQPKPSELQRKREAESRRKQTKGNSNAHEWVDLGLSVKWATMNIGANSPSDYGNYYAWGETTTKNSYTSETSLTNGKTMSELESSDIINSAGNLTMTHDAARVNWGSRWRMPTKAEMEELESKCQWLWTSESGHKGYRVTGPNGKTIFVPAAGICRTSLDYAGDGGSYWSSSCDDRSSDSSYDLDFGSGIRNVDWDYRYQGCSVRPVSE